MTQHVWEARRLTHATVTRGMGAYREARTRQGGLVPSTGGSYRPTFATGDGSYRLAFAFTGYFLERYRQSGSIATWALWAGGERYGHRYAKGANVGNYKALGRRVVCAALTVEWREKYAGPVLRNDEARFRLTILQTPLLHEPLLGALLGAFEEAGAWQPLRDYLEEKRYERMVNLFETGHPERVPSPTPLGGGIPFWADGSTLP